MTVKKMFTPRPRETIYSPEDYITPGAIEYLMQEGKVADAYAVQDLYGEVTEMTSMDPQDFWILAEEIADE